MSQGEEGINEDSTTGDGEQQTAYLLNPDPWVLRTLVDEGTPYDADRINVLLRSPVRTRMRREFSTATSLQEMVEDGTIVFREQEDDNQRNMFIANDGIGGYLAIGNETLTIAIDADEMDASPDKRDGIYQEAKQKWDDAEDIGLHVPSKNSVTKGLEASFSEEFADDYWKLLNSVESHNTEHKGIAGPHTGFETREHIHHVLALVAARHEAEFKPLYQTAESLDISNRSSLSKQRRALTDWGIVKSVKKETSFGRPPAILTLTDEHKNMSIEDMTDTTVEATR